MAGKKTTTQKETPAAAPPAELSKPSFPAVEAFIEVAAPEEVSSLFTGLKDQINALKGPRAEHGKKVIKALERTEELFGILLQAREKIEAERQSGSKPRK